MIPGRQRLTSLAFSSVMNVLRKLTTEIIACGDKPDKTDTVTRRRRLTTLCALFGFLFVAVKNHRCQQNQASHHILGEWRNI
ncbi:Uncharacterised protein [Kluyvera cryocrescens]|uniref:Uncharacterized protein n=1 Tax=Kluyvera cryocrescens TaxID=580 RepID=A0A2X3DQQ0_KLUCR|nr:Uncharacterised protein [Kluyvera cryocrescens]VFS66561.1 Uncharacterised protein [Kluyvera cryocrescens]